MRCKHCSTKIPADTRYCPRCGATVESQNKHRTRSTLSTENRCSYCNGTVKNSEKFCSHCGKENTNFLAPKTSRSPRQSPPKPPPQNTFTTSTERPLKSRSVAGILGILFGALGLHNFYLGETGKGAMQLILSLVGSIILIGPLVAFIWGFTEGIMLLAGSINTDGYNRPLTR